MSNHDHSTSAPVQISISMARRWNDVLVTSTVTASSGEYTPVHLANMACANLLEAGATSTVAVKRDGIRILTTMDAMPDELAGRNYDFVEQPA